MYILQHHVVELVDKLPRDDSLIVKVYGGGCTVCSYTFSFSMQAARERTVAWSSWLWQWHSWVPSLRIQSRDSCTILPNPSTKDLSMPQSYSELTYTNQSGLESELEVLCKKPSVLWLGIEFLA